MDGTPLAHRTDDEPDASAGGAKGRGFHTLSPNTPLTEAMARLLQTGVASLPVVDANGTLIDIYARSDVVGCAHGYPPLNRTKEPQCCSLWSFVSREMVNCLPNWDIWRS